MQLPLSSQAKLFASCRVNVPVRTSQQTTHVGFCACSGVIGVEADKIDETLYRGTDWRWAKLLSLKSRYRLVGVAGADVGGFKGPERNSELSGKGEHDQVCCGPQAVACRKRCFRCLGSP